jgi:glycosyltransferase involved in cell wall biosynthesis
MAKVLMLLEEEFPPDDRIKKEAVSLINEGFEVTLACIDRKNRPKTEVIEGIKVIRIPFSNFIYRLSATILVLPFYNWFWKRKLKPIFKDDTFSCIHVHDLPLSKIAHYFSVKNNTKLVMDQHEYYSNCIVQAAHYNMGLGKWIKKFSNWPAYENKYLNLADLVITVEEPLRDAYLKNYKLQPNQIIKVPNTPDLSIFRKENIKTEITERYAKDFVIFYAGGIDILRGIDLAIKALPIIKKTIPNIKFVMGGEIYKSINPQALAKEFGVEQHVEFVGWINVEDLPSYIAASNVCINISPVLREENNSTIATKVYQYVAMGKPVICGQGTLLKQFVEGNNVGLAMKDKDIADFAQQVIKIYNNPAMVNAFAQNAHNIIQNHSWDNTIKPLIEFYNNNI